MARLAGTGATLVLFTGFDVKVSALLEPLKKRNTFYNQQVRAIAEKYGAVLVDYWCLDAFHDRRMWDSDRLHMSKAGHKYLAGQVLDQLGVPHKIRPKDWEPPTPLTLREWERRQRRWVHDWVLPLFGRKLRGVTLGDELTPAVARARQGAAQGRAEEARRRGVRRRRRALAARGRFSRGCRRVVQQDLVAGGHASGVELHHLEVRDTVRVEGVLLAGSRPGLTGRPGRAAARRCGGLCGRRR